jgi:hypothetical protein
MSTKTSTPLERGEQTKLEALYRDLDFFLTEPMLQFDDSEAIHAGGIRKELGRLKAQICRVEKALAGLPSDASLDQVSEVLEQKGIIHCGRTSGID